MQRARFAWGIVVIRPGPSIRVGFVRTTSPLHFLAVRSAAMLAFSLGAVLWADGLAGGSAPTPTQAPARVTVSVDARRVLASNDRFWANAVFHPTEYLDSAWGKEHLALLHAAGVTTKYVRIYNQPEDAARVGADGRLSYCWDHFDRRADLILGAGSRLLVAFYSMPEALLADPQAVRSRSFLDGKKLFIGPPRYYRLWQEACADFTRHALGRYGEERVAQWRFTCWNEPDLAGFWKGGDLIEYRKLYDHFAQGVRSAFPRAVIGGPALSSSRTFQHPEHLRDFLRHVVSGRNHATGGRGAPLDYLAMHTYGGHGAGGSSMCPYPSIDYLLDQQRRLVAIRDEFTELRPTPIVLQEWGMSASGGTGMDKQPLAELRNTSYAPAFLTAMIARHIAWRLADHPRISDLFICLSGYEKERTRDFEGKRTVQTVHGFDKPVLNGYRALAKLGGALVACRVDPCAPHLSAIAARDAGRQVAALVTHFRNDHPANDAPAQPVALVFDAPWADGTRVELRHWRIDDRHSNAYTIFKELGRPAFPNEKQAGEIRRRMGLETLEAPRPLVARGTLRAAFDLPCNAVSLIEIVRQD